MNAGLCALIVGLCGLLQVDQICAQESFCANESPDLQEDESISRPFPQAGTGLVLHEVVSQLEIIITKAEQSRVALDATIATAKALRQQLSPSQALGVPITAAVSQGRQDSQASQLDLIGEQQMLSPAMRPINETGQSKAKPTSLFYCLQRNAALPV